MDQPASKKELVVRIPTELHQEVKERAESEERTVSQTIRLALRYYLKSVPPQVV